MITKTNVIDETVAWPTLMGAEDLGSTPHVQGIWAEREAERLENNAARVLQLWWRAKVRVDPPMCVVRSMRVVLVGGVDVGGRLLAVGWGP